MRVASITLFAVAYAAPAYADCWGVRACDDEIKGMFGAVVMGGIVLVGLVLYIRDRRL